MTSMASPLAQYSSICGVNVRNFVSSKLEFDEKSNNYIPWKEQMLCLIESHDLIDGESVAPEPSKQEYVVWRRSERLVKGWILGALSDELVRKCVKYETAKVVWMKLEKKFTRSQPPPPPDIPDKEYYEYMELYKATHRGEWDRARAILEQDPDPEEARPAFCAAIHIAVGTEKALHFVEKLLQKMSDEELTLVDRTAGTALHYAATTGNTAAARMLVDRLPELLYVPLDKQGLCLYPVHLAAKHAHKDTLELLISLTKDDHSDDNPYADSNGVLLLWYTIDADFYDIALHLVDKYPDMARMKYEQSDDSALDILSKKELAFPSGAKFNFWERLIYWSIDLLERESEATPHSSDDIEDPSAPLVLGEFRKWYKMLVQKLQFCLLVAIDKLVPHGRRTHTKKMMHRDTVKLVKCLCKDMESLPNKEAISIYGKPMIRAARLGIHEIVQEIIETFPNAIYFGLDDYYFFQVAAMNRCDKVLNLVYQTRDRKHMYSDATDSCGNTILHLVARIAPPHKLNLVSGAALQMQRELQWFKEVKSFVHPRAGELVNGDDKTPRMVFTEEHETLKVDGEKWMKDTANAYIIVAALIATVVFAAAITVPGGNNSDTGYPMFYHSNAFVVFAISDAASLFTSITSLLMFLSIMTSRYAEKDFLHALPNRLCIGLFTLFISIFFMMVSFGASAYIVLGQEKKWVLIAVGALGCLPIASFVLLQFP